MTVKTVEIDDTLYDLVDQCKTEMIDLIVEYCQEEEISADDLTDDDDAIDNIDDNGRVHEMIDSNTPIYNSEIRDIFYLHKNEVEEAYENSGIGENPLENNGMIAIYCYLDEQTRESIDECKEQAADKLREDEDDTDEDDTDEDE